MSSTSNEGIIACSTVLPVISIAVVSLRFHSRTRQKARLGLDDWLQIPSLLLFVAMCAISLYGSSRHAWGHQPPTATGFYNNNLFALLLYPENIAMIITDTLIKISALAFYKRLFCIQQDGRLSHFLLWSMGLVTILGIIFLGWFIGLCGSRPDALWESEQSFQKYCTTQPKWVYGYAVSDFIVAGIIMLIPIPLIWKLHMSFGRKASVSGVFLLALVGLGASLARVIASVQLSAFVKHASTGSNISVDVGGIDTHSVWLALLETGCSLIAVNLPSLRPLANKLSPHKVMQSLRSILLLQTLKTDDESHRGISSSAQDIGTNSPSIELVPTKNVPGWFSTVNKSILSSTNDPEAGIESGIYVHKEVEQVIKPRET